MNAQVQAPAPQATKMPSLKMGQTFLRGQIQATRKMHSDTGPYFLTLLMLPAPDLYSHPSTVEVSSKARLGAPSEEYSGVFQIRGYGRSFDSKPDEDGVITKIKTATHSFVLVEE